MDEHCPRHEQQRDQCARPQDTRGSADSSAKRTLAHAETSMEPASTVGSRLAAGTVLAAPAANLARNGMTS